MDNNTPIRRFLRAMIIVGVMVAIALLFGLFFAFSGNNPLLYHVAHVIDMLLVAITVLFVMGFIYMAYIKITGNGKPIFAPSRQEPKRKNADIPELADLIDSLDATDS